MKTYLRYFKVRLITNLQYRSAAIAGVLTQIFFGFMYVLLYIALYESNGVNNAPMNLGNLITYVWLGQAFFSLTHPYMKDKEIIDMIKNGNLAYELIRPQSFYFKFYIKMYASRIGTVILRFAPIIIMSLFLPKPYGLDLPASFTAFIIFITALVLASFLINSITMAVHILVMFLLESRGIFSFYSVMTELFMGAVVPLPFLPKFLQTLASILPFRYISDFPYRVYSGDISVNSGSLLLCQSLVWIIIFVLLGLLLSKKALRRAVIQGG